MNYLALIVLLALAVFYAILVSPFSGLIKFVLVFAEMVAVTQLFVKYYKFQTEMGLILLRSKLGLKMIKGLARHENAWKFMGDVGSVMSYGFLSFFLMRKNVNWKSLLSGMVLLTVISLLVAPSAVQFLALIIKGNSLQAPSKELSFLNGGLPLHAVLIFGGGLFAAMVFGVLAWAAVILSKIIAFYAGGSGTLSSITPGATFLLPGINIPLFEGLSALIIILVIHEGAHAVLASIARVPVRSSGLVLFGIIPVGAFVEPDEELLKKTEKVKQTRVIVAGSTINLLASVVFFLLFLVFYLVTVPFRNGVSAGMAAPVLNFIYMVLGLSFSLNFIIGTVNILPIPLFDGYRVLDINIENKMIVKAVMAITLAAFLVNLLPNVFG